MPSDPERTKKIIDLQVDLAVGLAVATFVLLLAGWLFVTFALVSLSEMTVAR